MKHLKQNNETYISHLKFACGLGFGLLYRSVFFLAHGIVPFVPVPRIYNIDETHAWLTRAKDYADNRSEGSDSL